MDDSSGALASEIEYHERLYSGFAQLHFAKAAVRALRAHMVERIVRMTGVPATARALSIGCGIGDTELLLAPLISELVGVDASPSAIRQAREIGKHTSELQSHSDLVCRLLLEKKKNKQHNNNERKTDIN